MGISRLKFELVDTLMTDTNPGIGQGNGGEHWDVQGQGSAAGVECSETAEFLWPGNSGANALSLASVPRKGQSLTLPPERARAPGWSSQSTNRAKSAGLVDAGLLRDLAAGLDYLNHELNDSDSELERARSRSEALEQRSAALELRSAALEQRSAALEQDAIHWHAEHESTLQQLLALRAELERSRRELPPPGDTSIGSVGELEQLATEQQRALILSLELVKRLESESQTMRPSAERHDADAEVELLRSRLDSEAFERGVLGRELEEARAQLGIARAAANDQSSDTALEEERARAFKHAQALEAEIAIQTAEVESRGAIITALESALEEQNASLRTLEERFLGYAEQVQSLQLERLEMPKSRRNGWFSAMFSPGTERRK